MNQEPNDLDPMGQPFFNPAKAESEAKWRILLAWQFTWNESYRAVSMIDGVILGWTDAHALDLFLGARIPAEEMMTRHVEVCEYGWT